MYLTYEEYLEFGGTADLPTFLKCEFRAKKAIDDMTMDRVSRMENIPMAVKLCMYELISQEQLYESTIKTYTARASRGETIAPVSSFSTDGYQESYSGGSTSFGDYLADFKNGLRAAQRKTIQDYLAYEYDDNKVKLLYRGVG